MAASIGFYGHHRRPKLNREARLKIQHGDAYRPVCQECGERVKPVGKCSCLPSEKES